MKNKNAFIIIMWILLVLYWISPIDILPEAIFPFIGYIDDLILTLISIYITKKVGGKK